ncbi:hypothetical protein PMIN06_011176 [Paraphaeosphaeria minitans]
MLVWAGHGRQGGDWVIPTLHLIRLLVVHRIAAQSHTVPDKNLHLTIVASPGTPSLRHEIEPPPLILHTFFSGPPSP